MSTRELIIRLFLSTVVFVTLVGMLDALVTRHYDLGETFGRLVVMVVILIIWFTWIRGHDA